MPDPKKVALVNQLRKKTLQGKVLWEATLEEGIYQSNFSDYSVRLFLNGAEYILQIYNEDGTLIEEFSDEDLAGGKFPETGGAYTAMKQTYEMARGTALGVDKALATLLSELGDE